MPRSNPIEAAAYALKWSQQPAQRAKQKARRSLPFYKDYIAPIQRRSMLKSRYGITHQDYLSMATLQDNKCAVCRTPEPGGGRGVYFDIDHCHRSGRVRALLCRHCNVTLGVLENNRELLTKLEVYLTEFDPPRKKG